MLLKKALVELKYYLSKYGLTPEDWALAFHHAYFLQGYIVPYRRKNHLHILVSKNKIPGKFSLSSGQFPEVILSHHNPLFVNLPRLIKKTGFDFDIVSFYDRSDLFVQNHTRWLKLNNKEKIRVATNLGNIIMTEDRLKTWKKEAPDHIERACAFLYSILAKAATRQDKSLVIKIETILNKFDKKNFLIFKKNRQAVLPVIVAKYLGYSINDKKFAKYFNIFKKTKTLHGQPAYPGKLQGKILVIDDVDHIPKQKSAAVIVVRMTSPRIVPLISKAKALITDEGGRLCHAAVIARELKIPCIVGTKIATKIFKTGDLVEVDAERGIVRKIK